MTDLSLRVRCEEKEKKNLIKSLSRYLQVFHVFFHPWTFCIFLFLQNYELLIVDNIFAKHCIEVKLKDIRHTIRKYRDFFICYI